MIPGIEDHETLCPNCGTVTLRWIGGKHADLRARGRCDWGNCTIHACANCGENLGRSSWGTAGFPDCPCDGHRIPKLRWPWTSKRFIAWFYGYHMWAFGLRIGDQWWTKVLVPLPYLLFGNFTGAQYRHARLHNPEYFERKRKEVE